MTKPKKRRIKYKLIRKPLKGAEYEINNRLEKLPRTRDLPVLPVEIIKK